MTARLVRTAAPSAALVTLDEAKDFVRIGHDADDAGVQAMIEAATARLDGPHGLLGRALLTQTWALTLDAWPSHLELPLPPAQAVDEITYTASDGTTATLDAAAYTVTGVGDAEPALVRPVDAWPPLGADRAAVTITFAAGYGDAADDVPQPIRQAALAIVAGLYDGRDGTVPGVDDLIAPYRLWAF